MDITVGNLYIDCKVKDIVKVTKFNSGGVYFDVIEDPNNTWAGRSIAEASIDYFLDWYVPYGKLGSAIYE